MAASPTQELILEVLVARLRTGETMWTFDSRLYKQAVALEDKGLVRLTHGVVEKTFRAMLTDSGKALFMDKDYVTPNQVRVNAAIGATLDRERARIAYGLGLCRYIPQEFTLHAMEIVNGGCSCQRPPQPSS